VELTGVARKEADEKYWGTLVEDEAEIA